MKIISLVLCTTLGMIAEVRAQAPETDAFAEFDKVPEVAPATTAPAAAADSTTTAAPAVQVPMENLGDPDPLDVLEKKSDKKAIETKTQEKVVEKAKSTPAPVAEKPVAKPESVPAVEIMAPEPPPAVVAPVAVKEKKKNKVALKKHSKENSNQVVSEDPNLRVEQRLHEIYTKYNQVPTNIESWDKAVGSRRSEVYRVQKGDTLWDLSQTFFADSNYWPKVWSLNKESILNPHQVEPKMSIRFYPGSLSEAPTLGILTQEKLNEPEKAPVLLMGQAETVGGLETLKMPVEAPPKPVGKIPSSLPIYRMGAVHKPQIDYDLPATQRYASGIQFLQYRLVDAAPSAVGKIKETEMGLKSAGEYQYVFINLDQSNIKHLIVIREKENLGGGKLIEIQGELEVIDKVNESNLYRAIVKKAINLVEVGSMLIPGQIPRFETTTLGDVTSSKPVRILSGVHGDRNSLFSRQSYLFLDSGREQGLVVGQTLPIYANQASRNNETAVEFLAGSIGRVKIIDVSENYATGYIVNTKELIQKGDWVGAPGVTIPKASSKIDNSEKEARVDEALDNEFEGALDKMDDQPEVAPKTAPVVEPAPNSEPGELQL